MTVAPLTFTLGSLKGVREFVQIDSGGMYKDSDDILRSKNRYNML